MPAPQTPLAVAKALARQLFQAALPKGPGWFGVFAFVTNSPLWRVQEALVTVFGDLRAAASTLYSNASLGSATGGYLEAWGTLVEEAPAVGETDEVYAARIQAVIDGSGTREDEIEAGLTAQTGVVHNVYAPWRDEYVVGQRSYEYADQDDDPNYGASGTRVVSSDFFSGGVLEVVADDYSSRTHEVAERLVAGGVKVYFSVLQHAGPGVASPPRIVHVDLQQDIEGALVPSPATVTLVSLEEHVEAPSVGSWNKLGYDTMVSFAALSNYTWAQAIAGPIYELPDPELIVTA